MGDISWCDFHWQFVGIMIALLDASPNANTGTDRAIIEVIVVLLNVSVLIWPLLRKFLSGTFHGYYEQLVRVHEYLHSKVFVRCCGVFPVLMHTGVW